MIGREVFGYRALADVLREEITSGRRPAGARMPSEKDLIQTYGIARATARQAIAQLNAEGRVVVRHGRPTVVAAQPERTEVQIELGVTMLVRRADDGEQRRLTLPPGAYVVELTDDEGVTRVFAADRHIFRPV